MQRGFPRLTEVGKTTVWRILNEQDIKPHRVRYYLEKRDLEFDRKMRDVLVVYQQMALYAEGPEQAGETRPGDHISMSFQILDESAAQCSENEAALRHNPAGAEYFQRINKAPHNVA